MLVTVTAVNAAAQQRGQSEEGGQRGNPAEHCYFQGGQEGFPGEEPEEE